MGAVSMRLPIRGGNWNNGANAGVPTLNLNNPRTNSNGNIGFRSALAPAARSRAPMGTRTVRGAKGTHLPTKRRSQRRKAKNWIAVKAVSRRKPNSATHGIFLWRIQHETDRQHLRDNLQF